MSDRYFTPGPITGERAVLTGAEAHHLIHVMRAGLGRRIELFDGSGRQWVAEVRRIARCEVELALVAEEAIDRELAADVTLAVALPKGERQRWLVEKAVELGVRRLVPLETARGVAQPGAAALERLRRCVIEASKQCGRNRLLELAPPQPWAGLLAATAGVPQRWMAHPGGGPHGRKKGTVPICAQHPPGRSGKWGLSPFSSQDPLVLAIGPEGGFTADEVAAAVQAGWQLVDLGPRTLRVETAAILLAALVAARSLEGP
jgi:16S rRNA (uracil1498-N3)-methyltransferase